MVIRLAVVEDHALVGAAMAQALASFDALEVVGLAATVDDGIALVAAQRPDVALVDLRIGSHWVTERMAELFAASPETRVLVVTAWATEHGLDQVLAAGASGLVSKDQPLLELIDAIHRVHAGELVVCPDLLGLLVRRATASDAAAPGARDLEVLELLADARSTADIARSLCMSEHTVRNRIRGCMSKLGTHTRVETVAEALRRGWVVPAEPDLRPTPV